MALKATNNPALYRRLSQPHDSVEVATQKVEAFVEELRVIREKYGIPDLYVILGINWLDADAEESIMEESTMVLSMMMGAQEKAVSMTAYAYGRETAVWEEFIAGTVKRGKKTS